MLIPSLTSVLPVYNFFLESVDLLSCLSATSTDKNPMAEILSTEAGTD